MSQINKDELIELLPKARLTQQPQVWFTQGDALKYGTDVVARVKENMSRFDSSEWIAYNTALYDEGKK